jgi:Ca2+-transporting ATPase
MKRGPRRAGEPVLTHQHWLAIGGWSALMAACVLVGLVAAIGVFHMEPERAVTVSFLTLAFAKLWFVFNLRDRGSRPLDNDVVRNPWIWGAITLCALLLVAAVYAPRLSDLLRTAHLGASGWTLALGLSLVPVSIGQVIRGLRNAGGPNDL